MRSYPQSKPAVNYHETLALCLSAKNTYTKAELFEAHCNAIGYAIKPIPSKILRYMANCLHRGKPFYQTNCAKALKVSLSTVRRHFRTLCNNGALQCIPVAVSIQNRVKRSFESLRHIAKSAYNKTTTARLNRVSKKHPTKSKNIRKGTDLDGQCTSLGPVQSEQDLKDLRQWQHILNSKRK